MEKKSLREIWDLTKFKVALTVALLSPLSVLFKPLFSSETYVVWLLACLLLQMSFVIVLLFDTQKLITEKSPKIITRIQLNDGFWNKNRKFKRLYISALNGERFIEMLTAKQIMVEEVKLICPSDQAISTYYTEDNVVNDKENAKSIIIGSIINLKDNIKDIKKNIGATNFELRRLSTFPLDFYAIFDGKYCLVGKYVKDPLRKYTIGLKSLSWIESDSQLVMSYTKCFEELWDSLTKEVKR